MSKFEMIELVAPTTCSETGYYQCTVKRGEKEYSLDWCFPEQKATFYIGDEKCHEYSIADGSVWAKAVLAVICLSGEGESNANDTAYIQSNCPNFFDSMEEMANAIDGL